MVLTVSYVKRQPDGTYGWPDKDDVSAVDNIDVVKMSSPSEDITRRGVRMSFDRNDVESARVKLKIGFANIC